MSAARARGRRLAPRAVLSSIPRRASPSAGRPTAGPRARSITGPARHSPRIHARHARLMRSPMRRGSLPGRRDLSLGRRRQGRRSPRRSRPRCARLPRRRCPTRAASLFHRSRDSVSSSGGARRFREPIARRIAAPSAANGEPAASRRPSRGGAGGDCVRVAERRGASRGAGATCRALRPPTTSIARETPCRSVGPGREQRLTARAPPDERRRPFQERVLSLASSRAVKRVGRAPGARDSEVRAEQARRRVVDHDRQRLARGFIASRAE